MRNKKLRRNDVILICVLLTVSAILFMFVNAGKDAGGEVLITVNGEKVMYLPLEEDLTMELSSEQGLEEGHRNLLHIKDGKAYIDEANCPDKVCIDRGEVCYEGETIVCLPHKLTVTVTEGEKQEIDGVSE